MAIRIGINGFGRIGRMFLRAALTRKDLEVVAVNDITDAATLAHLLQYDSIHGALKNQVKLEGNTIMVDGNAFEVLAERDPSKLPWKKLDVAIVVESTGLFTAREKAAMHLTAGARKVVISAPATGADATICLGINEQSYDPAKHHVVSNASCTTNCLAPVAKVLHEGFGIVNGLMTTVHSYTNDQMLLDGPHKDLRRARAAALSMVPTSTGAAKAIGLVLPALAGKLDGIAVRVPTPNVSLVDLTATVERDCDDKAVNAAMKQAADGPLKGILQYCDKPLVSIDFNGNQHSSIFDAPLTKVLGKRLVKVLSWYDNEYRGMRIAVEVGRDQCLIAILEDTFERAFGRLFHRRIDRLVVAVALDGRGQIDQRNIRGRHPHRDSVQLARQGRQYQTDRLGGAGRGRHHRERGRARPAQILMRPVQQHLVVGITVHGSHQAVNDAEALVDHLGDRRQAVGGAGCVGNHVMLGWVVSLLIDTGAYGGVGARGGSADYDLPGARAQVHRGLLARGKQSGRFHHYRHVQFLPRKLGRVSLGQHLEAVAVDHDTVALDLDLMLERAVN